MERGILLVYSAYRVSRFDCRWFRRYHSGDTMTVLLVLVANLRYRWREWRERPSPIYVSRYEERF